MSSADYLKLKTFLEERDVAIRAAKPLKEKTIIAIHIVGDETPYWVSRKGKKTELIEGEPMGEPQVTFTISPKAIDRLVNFDSEDIGEFGVLFFKIMVSNDEEQVLSAKLNTGFLGLTSIGVFGVLALGGKTVMMFLAKHGLNGLKGIKKAIQSMRNK